jgi:hypothetical protein
MLPCTINSHTSFPAPTEQLLHKLQNWIQLQDRDTYIIIFIEVTVTDHEEPCIPPQKNCVLSVTVIDLKIQNLIS